MSDVIQLLPEHVANQIAAGEVVQRPSSVVKELLENALDAGATHITLIIAEAGKRLIQVVDNGQGMSPTDARLSFERHATSKIAKADDLFQLQTKGFRGEALASIAAIAHVTLKTKLETNEIGTEIIIEGSQVKQQEAVVAPTGTSVAVKNLFYNIPARRKFLKSNAVEMRHIIDEFHRVVLAHPNTQFSMFNNDAEVFQLPDGNLSQRIAHVFGSKMKSRIVPVNETTEVVTISGFVGKPEFAKKSKGEQFFFVNNRFVKSGYLNHSITSAFQGLLGDGYKPSYFLKLDVPPESIDINIHPTKTEIKFDDEHTLYAILRAAVKHSLGQFQIAPILDFERDSNLDVPYNFKSKSGQAPAIEVDRNFNPFKNPGKGFTKKPTEHWEALYTGIKDIDEESSSNLKPEAEPVITEELFSDSDIKSQHQTFQIHNKYIISSIKSGVLIINQNRAHQRILYERFLQTLTTKQVVSQQLLFPVVLEFTVPEIATLMQVKSDLLQAGFVFSKTDQEQLKFSSIPTYSSESDIKAILEQLIYELQQDIPNAHFSATDILAKAMAKQLSIKTGQSLSITEQDELVNQLFACKAPNETPTHQKTFITMPLTIIDQQF